MDSDTSAARAFSLGSEAGDDGSFRRQESRFRDQVSADGSTEYPAEAGRYHLYVSWACPWAHRTIIGRRLTGLEDAIGLSAVDPIRDDRGWAFSGGEYTDPLNGSAFLSEAYAASDPDYAGRFSVPVLWDKKTGRIVNNESGEILRMLTTAFGALGDGRADLYPEAHHGAIDELNEDLYDSVNNAVYAAGFSTNQNVYERTVRRLFEKLGEMDARLADRRFLFGDEPVETDWRLFTTLLRLDAVYYIHFKCSLRRLVDHTNLWPYIRDLHQQPGIAETVRMNEIRAHYYRTHPMINPSGLVAVEPEADFGAPHGREALSRSVAAAS